MLVCSVKIIIHLDSQSNFQMFTLYFGRHIGAHLMCVTGRRRGARILTLTFTRKHSMLIQHGGQHEPRAILFPTIPSVTTRGWGG